MEKTFTFTAEEKELLMNAILVAVSVKTGLEDVPETIATKLDEEALKAMLHKIIA